MITSTKHTLVALLLSVGAAATAQPFRDVTLPLNKRIDDLMQRLTVDEKMTQLLHTSPVIERLGIPSYNWWNEGLHGVARFGRSTVFPQPIAMAATFDQALVHEVAAAISTEGRAKHNAAAALGYRGLYTGLTYWSPNINIFRDPRWGRGMETWGEDPLLTGTMAVSFIRGMQGNDSTYLRTAACAKHFAVHSGPESLRHSFNAKPPLRDLYQTYLPAFRMAVEQGGVEAVMTTYSALYGVPSSASKLLYQDILRGKWKFGGHVVSDCWAVSDIHSGHKYTQNAAQSASLALKNGVDLNCGEAYNALPTALKEGLVQRSDIDVALRRLLTTRFRLGLFDPFGTNPYDAIGGDTVGCASHQQLALEAARKSVVLLKNSGVLPLDRDAERFYVLGPNAADHDVLLGNYNGQTAQGVTIVEGITAKVGLGTRMEYRRGFMYDQPNRNTINWAMDESRGANAVIAVVGLSTLVEGEEGEAIASDFHSDRRTLALPTTQLESLRTLRKSIGSTPLVVVVTGGSPMDLTEVYDLADALLLAWYPGEQGGTAVADVLFGNTNPTGRLPITFPMNESQLPDYQSYDMRGRTYRYSEAVPLFPFGFGLGYDMLYYTDLKIDSPVLTAKSKELICHVTLRNAADRTVEEVVQTYITPPSGKFLTPRHDLKSFIRVSLPPQSEMTITVKIPVADLMYYDDTARQLLLKGEYRLYVGSSLPTERSLQLGARVMQQACFVVR